MVALVLGAGGTKGWAHVGVIKVLEEAGVPVDMVAGASAGALIGPLYAATGSAKEVERVACSFTPGQLTRWFLSGLRISPDAGEVGRTLWQVYGRLRFEELRIPAAVTVHDLATGERLVLNQGLVGPAVEASIRSPIFGRPTALDGRLLVDGGLQSAVPVDVAFKLGAEAVISVNVGAFYRLPQRLQPVTLALARNLSWKRDKPGGIRTQACFLARLLCREKSSLPQAHVKIRPNTKGMSGFNPWETRAALKRGEEAARRALPSILALLETGKPPSRSTQAEGLEVGERRGI